MTRAIAAIALVVTGLLSGCFIGPGKDNGADRLKDTVAAMPGVTSAGFATNDAELATVTLPNLFVTMTSATPGQIRAVVDTLKNNPHEDLDTVNIRVAEKPLILVSGTVADLDARQFVDDVERLRQLTPAVGPAAVVKWTRDDIPDGNLYVSRESPLPVTLAMIRESLGSIGLAEIYPGASSSVQRWRIYFPFSPEEERRVSSQLDSLPVQVGAVTVSSGVITELNVAVTDFQAVEPAMKDVIGRLGAGPDSPLMLSWQVGQIFLPAAPDGTVHVGACGYPGTARGDSLSSAEKELQQRLRAQFDTCPR
ncbi:hypothetical protein ACT17_04825 [Mycolicibacterium conceptionense]|jgi:hypothetical protein|uniref:Uncharacterized protein n=2 Tax=Mycolicibacterium TaxID=1866885 RepID=A0A0J8UI29_9MYCO|nr:MULTISPECIES: hypothetical protein [Mycolicibacterium]KLI06661.1 hypothetical protein AA982_17700 [Mycolicibacterium senegalense]KLO53739.1 hypothetical protein ABW05_21855 [Mycolicibacterium senegalense]KMV20025.1 hypothetical protein ACT17_04825 [Mycolicibacterium conceptionense]OBJ99185.1 hypothetical protein A5639_28705 [Mycolicibacterium conceptionense]OMB74605.1 hypothetical protein A5741_03420 [Mycolicibacterium conceptionense]